MTSEEHHLYCPYAYMEKWCNEIIENKKIKKPTVVCYFLLDYSLWKRVPITQNPITSCGRKVGRAQGSTCVNSSPRGNGKGDEGKNKPTATNQKRQPCWALRN